MPSDLGIAYDTEVAVERTIALALGRRSNWKEYKKNSTSLGWHSPDRSCSALVQILEASDRRVTIHITVTSPDMETKAVLGQYEFVGKFELEEPAFTRLAEMFPAPIGRILWNVEKDRYDNSVSIALLPGGRRLRIVHHTPKKPWHRTVRSTVYRGHGSFTKIERTSARNDCGLDRLTVSNYGMAWGDGELIDVEENPKGPSLAARIRTFASNEDVENGALAVLTAIVDIDDLWETRETAPKLAA